MKQEMKMAIRTLVEFILREGDIDNRYEGAIKGVDGIKAHQKIQNSYTENYTAEVPMKYEFAHEGRTVKIEGRADGILTEEGCVVIDEIKTTLKDIDTIDEGKPVHWAQAKCYGYIYSKEHSLETIDIQLTYFNIETEQVKYIRKSFDFIELEDYFYALLEQYKTWLTWESQWQSIRNDSLSALHFPFSNYRPGQRDLAVRVFKSIQDGNKCFAQAPTGIGKTISTLFPALKALGEGHTEKIFYLTAKTITREVAENTIATLKKQDLQLKSVTITAKEKVCKMAEVNCNPDYCPYAKGHFDRINEALKTALDKDINFTRDEIGKLSEQFMVCPFEFTLDLSLWADVIICDYNYVFDPRVYLKRFFEVKKTEYTFLIDEAHNLVDRAKEMYSAKLSKGKILDVKQLVAPNDNKLGKILNRINTFFLNKRKELEAADVPFLAKEEAPNELFPILEDFTERAEIYFEIHKEDHKELLELYFNVYQFLAISKFYSKEYVTLYNNESSDFEIKLYCVDPSKVLEERMKKAKSTIIFSATLLPMGYFKDMYCATEDDYVVELQSPFKSENRAILFADKISTVYSKREHSSKSISECIHEVVSVKTGNYMVFFPSYQYMELIYEKISELYPELNIVMQTRQMTEDEKETFILKFDGENQETHIGFCVLGSHFSEGIDLPAEKLIGVFIVGVGMPQIGSDKDIIKDYFSKNGQDGFDYAYVIPGMIKVLQAAGRCIRTEEDKGIIMLIDERYSQSRYQRLFPMEWYPNFRVKSPQDIERVTKSFWDFKK